MHDQGRGGEAGGALEDLVALEDHGRARQDRHAALVGERVGVEVALDLRVARQGRDLHLAGSLRHDEAGADSRDRQECAGTGGGDVGEGAQRGRGQDGAAQPRRVQDGRRGRDEATH